MHKVQEFGRLLHLHEKRLSDMGRNSPFMLHTQLPALLASSAQLVESLQNRNLLGSMK
jgi:hypothetical protein